MADNSNNQPAVDPAAGTIPSPVSLEPEEVVQQFRAVMERVPFPQAPPAHTGRSAAGCRTSIRSSSTG